MATKIKQWQWTMLPVVLARWEKKKKKKNRKKAKLLIPLFTGILDDLLQLIFCAALKA